MLQRAAPFTRRLLRAGNSRPAGSSAQASTHFSYSTCTRSLTSRSASGLSAALKVRVCACGGGGGWVWVCVCVGGGGGGGAGGVGQQHWRRLKAWMGHCIFSAYTHGALRWPALSGSGKRRIQACCSSPTAAARLAHPPPIPRPRASSLRVLAHAPTSLPRPSCPCLREECSGRLRGWTRYGRAWLLVGGVATTAAVAATR